MNRANRPAMLILWAYFKGTEVDLKEFRAAYPQYDSLPDEELAARLYKTHYEGKVDPEKFVRTLFPSPDINKKADEAVASVAKDLNALEKYIIGFRESTRTAAGRIAGLLGNQEAEDQAKRERELTKHVTGPSAFVGRVAPVVMGTSRFGGSMPQAAGSGAVSGYLTSDDPESGALVGGLGGAGGYAIGAGVGRLANSATGKFAERAIKGSDDVANVLKKAQKLGFRFTPGTASNSPTTRHLDAAMNSNPLTRPAYRKLAEHNTKLLNHYTAKALGVSSDDLGPSTLAKADDALSAKFDKIADLIKKPIRVDPSLADDLSALVRKGHLKPHLGKIQAGSLDGRSYMDLRSKLLAQTRKYGSDKVDDAWEMIDYLDDAAEKVAPKGYSKAYNDARQRYKVLLVLDRYVNAVKGGDAKEGIMNNALKRIFKKTYSRAGSTGVKEVDAYLDSVRALSEPRVGEIVGSSGTAERTLPWLTAGGLFFDPTFTASALAGGAAIAPRVMLGAPSKVGGNVGSAIGRTAANAFVETD